MVGVNLEAELRRFAQLPAADPGAASPPDPGAAASAGDGRLYGPPLTFMGRRQALLLCCNLRLCIIQHLYRCTHVKKHDVPGWEAPKAPTGAELLRTPLMSDS